MLNRRGFLATLAAVPLAALLPTTANAPVMACRGLSHGGCSCGLDALANDGTTSGTYAGVSRVPSRIYVYTGIDSGKWVSLR